MAVELLGALPAIKADIASIGPSTALALEERGLPPKIIAENSRAEGLASILEGRVAAGDRILLVRPQKTRPVLAERLREAGAEVDSVVFYRNVPAPEVEEIARDICDGRYDVIILTSPSTLARLREAASAAGIALDDALRASAVVTIGRVTAKAVEEAGLNVAGIAREPTVAGILEAVLGLFES
jgi:uroporphyrinogen-III synthase